MCFVFLPLCFCGFCFFSRFLCYCFLRLCFPSACKKHQPQKCHEEGMNSKQRRRQCIGSVAMAAAAAAAPPGVAAAAATSTFTCISYFLEFLTNYPMLLLLSFCFAQKSKTLKPPLAAFAPFVYVSAFAVFVYFPALQPYT